MSPNVDKETLTLALKSFGKHVAKLRKQRKWTQSELAARCRVDKSKVSKAERGVYDISFSWLHVLANGLGISIDSLLKYPDADHFIQTILLTE